MNIGCCIPASHAGMAAGHGYDFVELRVSELYPEGTVSQFRQTERLVEGAGIPALSFNFFLPPDLKVVGPDFDPDRFRRYVATAAERGASLGGRFIVFGSGGARRIPAGFPVGKAREQFRTTTIIAGEEVERYGMSIALEPLNHSETNLLHTVEEADRVAKEIEHPRVGVLADLYHMCMESEPLHHLYTVGERLLHVHVCDAGRALPGTRTYDLWGFFTHLHASGYLGAVSVECSFSNFALEGIEVLNTLRVASQTGTELRFS